MTTPTPSKYFPQIRDLVFADKFQEAEKMANDHFWGNPKAQEAYQPIGDLLLDFGTTNFTDYRRELDMETGIAKVSYRFGRRGDHARGVCLLARPCSGGAHQCGQAGSDELSAQFRGPYLETSVADGNRLVMDGTWKGPFPAPATGMAGLIARTTATAFATRRRWSHVSKAVVPKPLAPRSISPMPTPSRSSSRWPPVL